MGPHPAVAATRSAVRAVLAAHLDVDVDGAGPPPSVLVACSGGADSLALAAATAFEARKFGLRAASVTVDHGLQADSADQAERAAQACAGLGLLPAEVVRVEVPAPASAGGPENAARGARYRALDAAADRAEGDGGRAIILLGHTRDDQAETVLLGLGRGSGPRSVAGMPRRSGRYVRPLLGLGRESTEAACHALGLPFWTDPHNSDPGYRRVRLRTEALPLLEDVLGGGAAMALARTADLIREDLDALDVIAAGVAASVIVDGVSSEVDAEYLAVEPRAIRTRVLRTWLARGGVGALTSVHFDGLDGLLVGWHGQIGVDLPGGFRAVRRSGRLQLLPVAPAAPSPGRVDPGSLPRFV